MSSDCNFVYTLPEYVLDRTVIINGNHEHRVSGFKLAKASDYFKRQLIELRRGELEKSRIRARSLCDLQIEPLHVNYDDLIGFEMMLSFTHCSEEARCDLTKSLNSKQLVSILKAGTHFEVPDFVEYFIDAMKQKLTTQNVWDYWTALEPISDIAPDLTNFSRNFLLKHFLETCSSDEFLLQTADKLKLLLRDDALNASNELELFRQLERWVAVDPIKRSAHFGGLLACLRLGRLTAAELDEIKASIYVSENQQDCSRILSIAQSIVDSNTTGVNPSAQHDGIALDEGHAYSGCVLYKNRIYIIGGYISSGPTQMLKVLELATGTWRYLSPMHEKRNYICACLLDNAIYALGGHNGRHRLNTVERYDPEQNNWTFVSQMRQVRSDAGADSLNGKIYVCGGFDGHHFYDSVECYDPKVDQWTLLAPMQNIRSGVSVIGFNNCLYAIGGNDGLQRLRTVERYDPETNQWQTMPSMIRQRSNFCIVAMDDSIYVMGGWSDETNSTIALVEKWVPGMQNSWEQTKELYLPASANCCCGIKGLDVIKNFL
uniref:BACK domain-containing protein n=1 Tax=Mesocestoides corti TaxID=53468 RepID=A0A5K3FKI7_MESCO